MRMTRMFLLLVLSGLITISVAFDGNSQQSQAPSGRRATAEIEFKKWLSSFEHGGRRSTVVEFRYNDDTDEISAAGIAVPLSNGSEGGADLLVGKLRLKSFKLESAGVRFQLAVAQDIRFVSKATGRSITSAERVEVSDGFIPNFASIAVNPKTSISDQIRLLRNFGQAHAGGVNASKVNIGDLLSIVELHLSRLSDGKIAYGEIVGLDGTRPFGFDGGRSVESNSRLEVAGLVVKDVDLNPYIRLFEPSAYLDAGSTRPWSNLFASLSVRDIKLTNGPVVLSVASSQVEGFKTRQFGEYLTPIFDRIGDQPEYLVQNPQVSAQITAAIRDSFAVEHASMEGFDLSLPSRGAALRATLKGAAIKDLTASRVEEIKLQALKVVDPSGSLELNEGAITGLTVPATSNSATTDSIPTVVAPTVNTLIARGLHLDTQQVNLTLEQIDVAMSYFIGAIPTNLKSKVEHLKISTEQIGILPLRQMLEDFGYKDLDLSLNLSANWEDSSSSIAFDAIELVGKDIATLTTTGAITGITRASFIDPQGSLVPELMAGGLRNLRISFENSSLVERALEKIAAHNGTSVAEIKKLLSSNMPAIMAGIPAADVRNKFIFAAISFVNDPQVFNLVARSSASSAIRDVISALQEPRNLPVVLNFDASANARRK